MAVRGLRKDDWDHAITAGDSANSHNLRRRKQLVLQQDVASPCLSLKETAAKQWINYITSLRRIQNPGS